MTYFCNRRSVLKATACVYQIAPSAMLFNSRPVRSFKRRKKAKPIFSHNLLHFRCEFVPNVQNRFAVRNLPVQKREHRFHGFGFAGASRAVCHVCRDFEPPLVVEASLYIFT